MRLEAELLKRLGGGRGSMMSLGVFFSFALVGFVVGCFLSKGGVGIACNWFRMRLHCGNNCRRRIGGELSPVV